MTCDYSLAVTWAVVIAICAKELWTVHRREKDLRRRERSLAAAWDELLRRHR